MSKIVKRDNYRVVVEPRYLGDLGSIRMSSSVLYKTDEEEQTEYKKRCKEIEDQINRHVDNIGSTRVICDTRAVCSFCDRIWETEDDGTPVCCDKAIDEYEASKPQPA